MAATESDRSGPPRRRRLGPTRRLSLRLRLTVLYGACFLLGSGAVLGVTYLLVAHDTSNQTRQLHIAGSKVQLPRFPLTVVTGVSGAASALGRRGATMMVERIHISPSGEEVITWTPSTARSAGSRTSTRGSASRSAAATARRDNLDYMACMRAHGVPDYPDPGSRTEGGALTLQGETVLVNGQAVSESWAVVHAASARCQSHIDFWGGPRYSAAQLAKIRTGAREMTTCMRAHGVHYPELMAEPGPDGRGVEVGFVGGIPVRHDPSSRAFSSANIRCSKLLNQAFPATPSKRLIASSVQKQLNVVIERANGALTAQRSRSLRVLLTWLGVALGVLALISILLGWLLAGGALRPIWTMTSRARGITEDTLHERLSADAGEDELGVLASTFDGVLARLERAFDAKKRFVANASHELRTPLTLERTLLEVALADPDADAEALRQTCERVLASTEQQQQLIEALLTLARSQRGTDLEVPVDLAELAQEALSLREQRLSGLTLAADLHAAPLHGDPALLERLVANLIDNAITHNRAQDGWIAVETGRENAGSWLRVSNSGLEVPERMIPELFEPFRRIEGERTTTATGLGLGLSIVQAIVEVHDATIEARPLDGGGLRVDVHF